jgi:hypothetical protein
MPPCSDASRTSRLRRCAKSASLTHPARGGIDALHGRDEEMVPAEQRNPSLGQWRRQARRQWRPPAGCLTPEHRADVLSPGGAKERQRPSTAVLHETREAQSDDYLRIEGMAPRPNKGINPAYSSRARTVHGGGRTRSKFERGIFGCWSGIRHPRAADRPRAQAIASAGCQYWHGSGHRRPGGRLAAMPRLRRRPIRIPKSPRPPPDCRPAWP